LDWLTVELVSIFVVLVGGFGTLSYQVGRWRKVIEDTRDCMKTIGVRVAKVEERLGHGGATITRLEERTQHMKEGLDDIKIILRDKESRR
jgi:hypothetical protein